MAGEIAQRAIEIAHEYVGKVESKFKPNWADWLEKLMKDSGNPTKWIPGEPYCIAALGSCFALAAKELGKNLPIQFWKGTRIFYDMASKKSFVSQKPEVGDVVIFSVGTQTNGHAGIVVGVTPDEGITTIEFNTSNTIKGSQRNGEGVYMKFRRFRDFQQTDKPHLWIRGYVKTSRI